MQGPVQGPGVGARQLAVEIGQVRIVADHVLDAAGRLGAVETRRSGMAGGEERQGPHRGDDPSQ